MVVETQPTSSASAGTLTSESSSSGQRENSLTGVLNLSLANVNAVQASQHAEGLQQPNHDRDDYDGVQDAFDLAIQGK